MPPVIGFITCLTIWLSLRTTAMAAGFAWLVVGVLYGGWRTGGFRKPIRFEASVE